MPTLEYAEPTHDDYFDTEYLRPLLNPQESLSVLRMMAEALSGHEYDAIAFRGHSGTLIAGPLAILTGKPLILVRKSRESAHTSSQVEGYMNSKRYVIADDFIRSGETVNAILRAMKCAFPQALCIGVLCAEGISHYALEACKKNRVKYLNVDSNLS